MKKQIIFTLVAVLMFGSIGISNMMAKNEVEDCYSSAQGNYYFSIAEPIEVEVSDDYVFLGEICPGCSYEWDICDCPEMIFTITGGHNCYFSWEVEYSRRIDDVWMTIEWQYWNPVRRSWIRARDRVYPFNSEGEAQMRACVKEVHAGCYAESMMYEFEIRFAVQYTCGIL